jgi:hypothetical protein
MKSVKRPTLALKGNYLIEPVSDRPLQLGVYDVLLPCRQFIVSHKVAEVGRVSLTGEFLLRLLKSVDGMNENDVAAFFGYDEREMPFVLSEVETNDFVTRKDGRVYLTTVGQALFRDGSEYPEIFEVITCRERTGFDLIALAPEERRYLDSFERRLPELRTRDAKKISAATQQIPSAFRKFYGEIVSRRDPTATVKRSLYSIDNVAASDRFSSTVRISVQSTGLRPSTGEPDLSEWRPEYEREDRGDIIEAASRFVEDLKVARQHTDADAYQVLIDIAPSFLKDFARRDGLAVERYYREAFTRTGDVRSDRPTVPLLGSLFTRENTRRLFEVAEYGLRSVSERPTVCLWFAPQTPYWGATTALPEILDQIKSRVLAVSEDETRDPDNRTICLIGGRAAKHVETAFDLVGTSDAPSIPASLEMLLVPNVLTALAVNAPIPIGVRNGLPVSLGLVSFDLQVIERAKNYAMDQMLVYSLPRRLHEHIGSILSIKVTDAEKSSAERT